jgi:hypothetical protein
MLNKLLFSSAGIVVVGLLGFGAYTFNKNLNADKVSLVTDAKPASELVKNDPPKTPVAANAASSTPAQGSTPAPVAPPTTPVAQTKPKAAPKAPAAAPKTPSTPVVAQQPTTPNPAPVNQYVKDKASVDQIVKVSNEAVLFVADMSLTELIDYSASLAKLNTAKTSFVVPTTGEGVVIHDFYSTFLGLMIESLNSQKTKGNKFDSSDLKYQDALNYYDINSGKVKAAYEVIKSKQ